MNAVSSIAEDAIGGVAMDEFRSIEYESHRKYAALGKKTTSNTEHIENDLARQSTTLKL